MCVYIDIWTVLTDKMSLFVTRYGDCNNTGCPLVLDNDAIFCNFTADHSKFGSNNQDVVEVQLQEQLLHYFF